MRTVLLAAILSLFACTPRDREAAKDRAELTWEEAAQQAEYVVERGTDGAVTAWRETEQVAGHADDTLTDAAVMASVKARMMANRDVSANQIDVDVKDRVVTLRGRVDSLAEAQMALRLALDTRGVDRVVSYLTY
jgi:osmotically-inducible protein OsmY